MQSKKETVGVIAFPDSHGGVPGGRSLEARDAPSTRVVLLGQVVFHREALAGALRAYDDIVLLGAFADVHAALILAEEGNADVLVVDTPSDAVVEVLAAHPLEHKVVFIGPVGERCHQMGLGAAIFVGASSSLDEVHVALRFAQPRQAAARLPASLPQVLDGGADSILTLRELEVGRLVAGGCSNKEIADACGISLSTVKNHVHRILAKLNVQRRTQIARLRGDPPLTIPRKPAASTESRAGLSLPTGSRPRT